MTERSQKGEEIMPAPNGSGKKGSRAKPGLISRSTILILSGVLIGLGFGGGYSPSFHYSGLMAGWVGLIAYIALDWLARRRKQAATQRKLERKTSALESRIFRVIPRPAKSDVAEDLPTTEESFVPVVSSR